MAKSHLDLSQKKEIFNIHMQKIISNIFTSSTSLFVPSNIEAVSCINMKYEWSNVATQVKNENDLCFGRFSQRIISNFYDFNKKWGDNFWQF